MKPVSMTVMTISALMLAPQAMAGAKEALAEKEASFEAAFNSGDAAGVAALYTEDAVVMAPDAARVEGRAAIQELWQGYVDAGAKALDLTTTDVEDLGDTLNQIGTYTISVPDSDGNMMEHTGKYIVVWKRSGDDLMLHWDIWNDDPPK